MLDRVFRLSARGTSVRTEVLAGVTTFLAMAYIVFVNPAVLSQAGMDFGAVFTATCLASAAATLVMALAANYPFATIEPNTGVVQVPDPRLDTIAAFVHPERTLPATVEFLDIAGLVKGAASGEGLGNKFLSHIRDVDTIAHIVRCFDDGEIVHVLGSVDPLRDIEIIESELGIKDVEMLDARLQRVEKLAKGQHPRGTHPGGEGPSHGKPGKAGAAAKAASGQHGS